MIQKIKCKIIDTKLNGGLCLIPAPDIITIIHLRNDHFNGVLNCPQCSLHFQCFSIFKLNLKIRHFITVSIDMSLIA